MEDNDYDTYLLPEKNLWMPYNTWINIFALISILAQVFYFTLFDPYHDLCGLVFRSNTIRKRITIGIRFIAILSWFYFLVKLKIETNPNIDGASDHLPYLLLMLGCSICVELGILCYSENTLISARSGLCNWRFLWFLIWVGATSMANYYVIIKHKDYEYFGPMRITKASTSLWTADPETFPCLEGSMHSESYKSIQSVLTVEWGNQWGCKFNIEKWNRNWKPWLRCSKLICPTDSIDDGESSPTSSACSCYENQDVANQSSWECLQGYFNVSKMSDPFCQDQPPWRDPSWPTISLYGNCEMPVGYSEDSSYVRKVLDNAERHKSFGLVCLLLGFGMMASKIHLHHYILEQRRNNPGDLGEETANDEESELVTIVTQSTL